MWIQRDEIIYVWIRHYHPTGPIHPFLDDDATHQQVIDWYESYIDPEFSMEVEDTFYAWERRKGFCS